MTTKFLRLAIAAFALAFALQGCASLGDGLFAAKVPAKASEAPFVPATTVDGMIREYAELYDVPEVLVRRVVQRESKFNPGAHHGPYWGLMQIRHDTAKSMGYKGSASGLLDARQNLTYGVKYLRGAYLTASKNHDRAMRLYASGYYYDAKRKGLLKDIYGR